MLGRPETFRCWRERERGGWKAASVTQGQPLMSRVCKLRKQRSASSLIASPQSQRESCVRLCARREKRALVMLVYTAIRHKDGGGREDGRPWWEERKEGKRGGWKSRRSPFLWPHAQVTQYKQKGPAEPPTLIIYKKLHATKEGGRLTCEQPSMQSERRQSMLLKASSDSWPQPETSSSLIAVRGCRTWSVS